MLRRDRALVVANRLPYPLDDGWKVRTFQLVRQVAREMPVVLVVFDSTAGQPLRDEFEREFDGRVTVVGVPPPRAYSPWRLLLGAVTRRPVHYWNNRSRRFARAAATAARVHEATVGIAVSAFMYPYLEELPSLRLRVIDTHNVDSDLMNRYVPHVRGVLRRAYARRTAARLKVLEDDVFPRADRVWVCSRDEADLLARSHPPARVSVIPNGVDTVSFAGNPRDVVRGRLLFFGKLNYFPNADALEFLAGEVLPLLSDLEYEVLVAGADAAPATVDLCQRTPRMRLAGRVADVRPLVASADLVIVPLRMGSGTRLKVLEAMAAGRPVLSTTVGAEGIRAVPGRDILTADTAEAFAAEIRSVLMRPELGDAIGRAGQEVARREYDWTSIGRLLGEELAAAESRSSRDRA